MAWMSGFKQTIFVILAGAGLPGCVNDGGTSSPNPVVITTSPSNDAVAVAVDTDVTVTFNRDVLGTSVDANSFSLAGPNGAVAGAIGMPSGQVAAFMPSADLGLLSRYTATLTTAIADLFGNPLVADYSWDFTTRDGVWGMEDQLTSSIEAALPQISFDRNGNAIAVWQQYDTASRYSIYVRRYVAGIGWDSAQAIEAEDTYEAIDPQIEIDSTGNAIAIWRQYDGTRYNIYANRYVAGIGWGVAGPIETNDGDASAPRISLDANGNAIAIWSQHDGTHMSIYSNRYINGSGWDSAQLVETNNAEDGFSPNIALDSNGNAIAVWLQNAGFFSPSYVWVNRYSSGSGWGVAQQIGTGISSPFDPPKIAFDAQGNATAIWSQSNGAQSKIFVGFSSAGGAWTTPQAIGLNDTATEGNPQIAFDADANALAVWVRDDGDSAIWANRYVAGAGWGVPQAIGAAGVTAVNPQVAIDTNGNAIAVWAALGATPHIQANRYLSGSGWGVASFIESDGNAGTAYRPQITLDMNGYGIAIWYQNDGVSGNHIWANRFE